MLTALVYVHFFIKNELLAKYDGIKIWKSSFKSREYIHKKEHGPDYVVSANKASSVTLTISGDETREKHTVIS